tara:strand:- start:341 stop:1462 length:1122 start_codon:yes stop_codon:yes gene_type:complete
MRICFILNYSKLYGANKSILSVIQTFLSKGHQAHVILPESGPITEIFKKKNINFSVIPHYSAFLYIKPSFRYLLLPFLFLINVLVFPYLLLIVSKFNPNVIYSNTSAENMGVFIAKILNLKHIWHIREFMSLDHNAYFIFGKKMKSRLINMSDRSIYVSNSVLEEVHSMRRSVKYKVIYNGVKSRMKLSPSLNCNNEPVFGIVGILDSGKQQDIAIEYFNKLLLYYPNAKLYIFGDKKGSFKNKLFNLVDDLGLKEKVHFKGFINSQDAIYSSIDILLMFSRSEGFGRVTIESALHGVPVIGFNNAGTSELIIDKRTGCLFKDFDSFLECVNFIMNSANYNLIREQAFLNANKRFNVRQYCDAVYSFVLNKIE